MLSEKEYFTFARAVKIINGMEAVQRMPEVSMNLMTTLKLNILLTIFANTVEPRNQDLRLPPNSKVPTTAANWDISTLQSSKMPDSTQRRIPKERR